MPLCRAVGRMIVGVGLTDTVLYGNYSPGRYMTMAKHIFVTGGVVSSLGKGLTSASIGMLLEKRGLRVRMQKLDPYINVDPGTMSPYQHGEVYVLDDGSETDLDLRSEEHTSELQSPCNLVCRLLLEKKKKRQQQ